MKFTGKKYISLISIIMLLSVLLVACSSEGSSNTGKSSSSDGDKATSEGVKENVILGTHPQGSAYNSTSAGIAKVLSTKSSIKASIKPYAGTNAFFPLVDDGQIDMGLSSAPDLVWGIKGEFGYKNAHKNIRTLVIGNYPPTNGLIVREDSGISKTADLKGKRIASGYAGNQVAQSLVELHLKSVGLTWDDVEAVPVASPTAGLEALRDGRVDAAMGSSPLTAAAIETDAAVGGLKVLNIADVSPEDFDNFPEEVAAEIAEGIPGTRPFVYQGGGFVEEPVIIFEYPVILNASTNMSDETAYEIVKTLFENYEELHPVFSWLKEWSDKSMFEEKPPAPYHPGAIKYFKEKGLWTEDAEKYNEELLQLVN